MLKPQARSRAAVRRASRSGTFGNGTHCRIGKGDEVSIRVLTPIEKNCSPQGFTSQDTPLSVWSSHRLAALGCEPQSASTQRGAIEITTTTAIASDRISRMKNRPARGPPSETLPSEIPVLTPPIRNGHVTELGSSGKVFSIEANYLDATFSSHDHSYYYEPATLAVIKKMQMMPRRAMRTVLSRRQFLTRVAAIGGIGAAFLSMQGLGLASTVFAEPAPIVPPEIGAGLHVVILGAGIAGLVMAYRLERAEALR